MEEIWKTIEGYEGLYEVSNLGRFKRLVGYRCNKERILSVCPDNQGYGIVVLCKNSITKTFKAHRLVAQSFIPNPNNLPMINHKDEDKTNNTVYNLEWCDAKYNTNYGTSIKRRSSKMINNKYISKPVLCIETGIVYQSGKEASRQLKINYTGLACCCQGKIHYNTAGGYHWAYVNNNEHKNDYSFA